LIKLLKLIINNITLELILKQLKECGQNSVILYQITTQSLRHITIGNNFEVCSHLRIKAFEKYMETEIIIGNNFNISYDYHIVYINKVVIGNSVLITSKVFIIDHFHGNRELESFHREPRLREIVSKGPVFIEDNVWIGEGVSTIPNVRVGKNSVVTKDIAPFSFVGGISIKVIKRIKA